MAQRSLEWHLSRKHSVTESFVSQVLWLAIAAVSGLRRPALLSIFYGVSVPVNRRCELEEDFGADEAFAQEQGDEVSTTACMAQAQLAPRSTAPTTSSGTTPSMTTATTSSSTLLPVAAQTPSAFAGASGGSDEDHAEFEERLPQPEASTEFVFGSDVDAGAEAPLIATTAAPAAATTPTTSSTFSITASSSLFSAAVAAAADAAMAAADAALAAGFVDKTSQGVEQLIGSFD